MAGRDMKIDPSTRDYISDGAGGYETTLGADTALYHQMEGHKGRWVLDRSAGSRLFELTRGKSIVGKTVRELQDMIEEAAQPLVDEGRISDPEFHGEREVTRVIGETTFVDLALGDSLQLGDILDTPA